MDLGSSLVRVGFANIIETIHKEHTNYAYLKKLKAAHTVALKRELGVKYYINLTTLVFTNILRKIFNIVSLMAKKSRGTAIKKLNNE